MISTKFIRIEFEKVEYKAPCTNRLHFYTSVYKSILKETIYNSIIKKATRNKSKQDI